MTLQSAFKAYIYIYITHLLLLLYKGILCYYDTMDMKFHRSVTLSKKAIEFVSSLDGKSFSDNLERVINTYRNSFAENKRADNLEMLRKSVQVLKRDCDCPDDAIKSWTREAMRSVK